jgi:predicted DNA-binding transcriptional regulator YafY
VRQDLSHPGLNIPGMDSTFPRLYALLQCIPRTGKVGTSELVRRLQARGFKAYPRMVQRDLQLLAGYRLVDCDGQNTHYGWRWPAGAQNLPLAGMTAPQALSFHLVESYLRDLMPAPVLKDLRPWFEEARRTLADLSRAGVHGRWPERIRVHQPDMPLVPPKVSRAVHDAVTEALLLGRQLRVTYRNRGRGKDWTHPVHPLGLVQHGRVHYLVARFYDYDDLRLLALHRMPKAELLEDDAAAPAGFSLDAWLESGAMGFGGSGRRMRVRLEFSGGAGNHLLESPLAADQKSVEHGDGRVTVSANVQDTERLRWWLLGFGENVKVLAPKALRGDMARRLEAASAGYRVGLAANGKRRKGEHSTTKEVRP